MFSGAAQHLSALPSSSAQIFSVRSSSQEDARPQEIDAESPRSPSVPSSFPAQAPTPMRAWSQHLLRLKLRVAKREGRETRAA